MQRKFQGSCVPVGALVVKGCDAVLEHGELLAQFAEHCDQAGGMHWLSYFLGGTGLSWKRPCLVMLVKVGVELPELRLEDLFAVGLFFEVCPKGVGTGVYSTDDRHAVRTVISPAGRRSEATAMLAEVLMERGAQVVLLSYACTPADTALPGPMLETRRTMWAEREQAIKKQMTLGPTYDDTLARLGKRTRTHLRYYRKRLLEKMECEFIGDIRSMVDEAEMVDFSLKATYAPGAGECRRRYRAASLLPEGFLMGLRGPEGQWLSVAAGWRQGTTTILHHQVNAPGFEKDSISTVMRSYLLEHEVARGAKRLICYQGTLHPMGHSFEDEVARDLIVRRRSLRASLIRKLAPLLISEHRGGGCTLLAMALSDRALQWHAVVPRETARGSDSGAGFSRPVGAVSDAD